MALRVTKSLGKFYCGLAADWSGLVERTGEPGVPATRKS